MNQLTEIFTKTKTPACRFARTAALSILFVLLLFFKVTAQGPPPPVSCLVTGQTPVTQGDTWTYSLAGVCSASSLTVTFGSIVSSSSSSVTVYFNVLGCSSSLITAVGTGASKTVTVNALPLNGGSISNPTQTINYNTAPALIDGTFPSGGFCSSYSYQWYSSPNNSTYSSISGATGQNYQPPALTSTT